MTDIRELARKHAPQAINALVKVAKSGKSESQRVAAACKLLDLATAIPVAGKTSPSPLPEYTDEQRAKALTAFLAKQGLFVSKTPPAEPSLPHRK
jgi:hypothetical protein